MLQHFVCGLQNPSCPFVLYIFIPFFPFCHEYTDKSKAICRVKIFSYDLLLNPSLGLRYREKEKEKKSTVMWHQFGRFFQTDADGVAVIKDLFPVGKITRWAISSLLTCRPRNPRRFLHSGRCGCDVDTPPPPYVLARYKHENLFTWGKKKLTK